MCRKRERRVVERGGLEAWVDEFEDEDYGDDAQGEY